MLPLLSVARPWSLALLLMGACELSQADTVWQCWYDGSARVACALSPGAAQGTEQAPLQASPEAPAASRPGPMPAFVNVLHNTPRALRGQVVHIPLHSEPTDHRFVGQLVQSVMCAGRAGCLTIYETQSTRSLARAMATADAIDPLTTLSQ